MICQMIVLYKAVAHGTGSEKFYLARSHNLSFLGILNLNAAALESGTLEVFVITCRSVPYYINPRL